MSGLSGEMFEALTPGQRRAVLRLARMTEEQRRRYLTEMRDSLAVLQMMMPRSTPRLRVTVTPTVTQPVTHPHEVPDR